MKLGLVAALLRKAIDDHGGKEEEHDAQDEEADGFAGDLVLLHGGIEVGAVGGGGEQCPEKRQPGGAIEGGGDDGEEVDGPIAAVDAGFAGVVDENGGKKGF